VRARGQVETVSRIVITYIKAKYAPYSGERGGRMKEVGTGNHEVGATEGSWEWSASCE